MQLWPGMTMATLGSTVSLIESLPKQNEKPAFKDGKVPSTWKKLIPKQMIKKSKRQSNKS